MNQTPDGDERVPTDLVNAPSSEETCAREIVKALLPHLADTLLSSNEEVASALAETNAVSWSSDAYILESARFSDAAASRIRFAVTIRLSGNSSTEQACCDAAATLDVVGVALAADEDGMWFLGGYTLVRCKISSGEPNPAETLDET